VIAGSAGAAVRRGPDATLSVVVPVYNEADNVGELLRRITQAVHGLSQPPAAYEVILVDDGSRDATFEKLQAAAHDDPHLRIVSLSRNFGHQIAATAGLDASRGRRGRADGRRPAKTRPS